jgi:hypothetical protein
VALNPIPNRITPQLWQLWETIDGIVPTAQLGGIYANKRGYHNTVNANLASWPNDYSVQQRLDLQGPRDKARGLDVTLSPAEMRRRTGYLRRAALHPDDDRLRALREFIGTLDGINVYCLIRDSSGTWRFDGGRDKSHLTHIHKSVYTTYVDNWNALGPIASVYAGVTWEDWQEDQGVSDVYFKVQSSDPEWNGQVWLSNRIHRRKLRAPGEIQGPARAGALEVVLTDAMRLGVSAGTDWDEYLSAVAGPPFPALVCECNCEGGGGDGDGERTFTGTITGTVTGTSQPTT